MGYIPGTLIERIQKIVPQAPLVNVLVVNQNDRLPSDGAGLFMAKRFKKPKLENKNYKKLHPKKWKRYFDRAASEVYAYSWEDWALLYEQVFGAKLSEVQITQKRKQRIDGNENDFGSGASKYGAGGEGCYHKSLRLWVKEHPCCVHKSFKEARAETEVDLDSGDRVDVVYHLSDRTIVLEVKSRISNADDFRRGVYQCIKYRSVKKAMDVRKYADAPVDAILVTETPPTGEIIALLKLHNISHFQAPLDREQN